MSFSDSGLRMVHVVLWNCEVNYAIVMRHSPLWQSSGEAAQITNSFIYIKGMKKNIYIQLKYALLCLQDGVFNVFFASP